MEPIALNPYRVSPKDTLRWCNAVEWKRQASALLIEIVVLVALSLLIRVPQWSSGEAIVGLIGMVLLIHAFQFYQLYTQTSHFHEAERQVTMDETQMVIRGTVLEERVLRWDTACLTLVELPECFLIRTLLRERGWSFSKVEYMNLILPRSLFDDHQMAEFQKVRSYNRLLK
jgi:hypothetical protein